VALACLSGCGKNPGKLNKSEVEAKVKEVLKLKDLSLTESPDGGYTGKGTGEDGTKYDVTVTQDEKQKKLIFRAKGENGEIKTGTVKQL
jgi:hypothetical protein